MTSSKGVRGERGKRGATGAAGSQGHRGARGERGPAGPVATRSQILEAVQNEFDAVRKELRAQLERMAQIQVQLDSIQRMLTTMISKGS
jgi:hypothetical protein